VLAANIMTITLEKKIIVSIGIGRGYPLTDIAYMVRSKSVDVYSVIQDMLIKNILRKEIYQKTKHYYFLYDEVFLNKIIPSEYEAIKKLIRQPKRPADTDMCHARMCMGHLAGNLGINLKLSLFARGYLILEGTNHYKLSDEGVKKLQTLGVALYNEYQEQKQFKSCLDWTERSHHLGGKLGEAITAFFINKTWLVKKNNTRALYLTEKGKNEMQAHFGLKY